MDDQLRANLGRELLPHTFMGELRAALDAIAPIIEAALVRAHIEGARYNRTPDARAALLAAADDADAFDPPCPCDSAGWVGDWLRARANEGNTQ